MDNGFMRSIRDRVLASADGSVFTSSDFADIADTGTIRQSLNRLVQEKILRRILRGVFEKPKYSKLLGEYVAVGQKLSLDNCALRGYCSESFGII